MRLISKLLFVVPFCLLASVTVVPQQKREAQSTKRSFSAKEVASRFLPSVVLIVCDDGKGGISQGSGFFVGPGQILTNYHVIENMLRGQARSSSVGSSKIHWIKQVLYTDKLNDLALLSIIERPSKPVVVDFSGATVLSESAIGDKIEIIGPEQVSSLKLSLSQTPNLGDPIFVLSNPEGLAGTISQGIVSGGIRKIKGIDLLQIDASISSGSSGGPVLNAFGEVVGIATGSFKDGQNLNFAIPALSVRRFLDDYELKEATIEYASASTASSSWMVEAGSSEPSNKVQSAPRSSESVPVTGKPISTMTYDELRMDLLAALRNSSFKPSDKFRQSVSSLEFSGCSMSFARSSKLGDELSKRTYLVDLRDIGEFGFTTFSKDVVMYLNLELTNRALERADYGLLEGPFEASFTNEIQFPVQLNLEEASRILIKFRRLKDTCSGPKAGYGPSLDESTSWLTDRIQGTSSFSSAQTSHYKTLRFSGCSMVFVRLVSGEIRIQYSYQPSLRNLRTVEVTKNAAGNWGIWLEFSRNFDVATETFGPFGSRETAKEDKITIFFDTYEKAKRAGTAFARVLELCGEETKEPF